MIDLYDMVYAVGVGVSAPFWLLRPAARDKVRRAFSQRMGQVPCRDDDAPAVWIHAVSLGEINATKALVQSLSQQRPELRFIISSTTETGYTRGSELYGANPRVTLIRYPLDFSPAIERVLDRLRPSLVVLMELELWPNFLHLCRRRRIPVVLVNGRVTRSSFRNYRLAKPLVAPMFASLAQVCAQEETYAKRFIALGADPRRVRITGTMKFDTAQVGQAVAGDRELAEAMDLADEEAPLWVCGSTGPGEEAIVLHAYRQLLVNHPSLRLAIIPRHPQRFDEVAQLIESEGFPLLRRSRPVVRDPQSETQNPPVLLGDTMGELRKFYSLASVVFVGRSLVDLGPRQHGSDMIEPCALAKPTLVGPFTGNFAEVMTRFRDAEAIGVVRDEAELLQQVDRLLTQRTEAQGMARRAQQVVRQEQGATGRHVGVILGYLRGGDEAMRG